MEEVVQSEDSNILAFSASNAEHWAKVITSSNLVLVELQQQSLRRVLTALTGGNTAEKNIIHNDESLPAAVMAVVGLNQVVRAERTVTVNRSAAELYNYWRDFKNLPTFMHHIQAITVINAHRSHWVAKAPLNQSVEWDSDIVNDRPNELIAWTSVIGTDFDHSGFVRFKSAPADRGTEVKVVTEYKPLGGMLGNALAKLFGASPEQLIGDQLNRFKQIMEAGEIATTKEQSSSRAHDRRS